MIEVPIAFADCPDIPGKIDNEYGYICEEEGLPKAWDADLETKSDTDCADTYEEKNS